MPINTLQVEEFRNIFCGSRHNYGEHTYGELNAEGKREGESKTIRDKLLTVEEYKAHLNGGKGLGIIPITDSNKCKFAVIDIDIYNVDLSLYVRAIERNKFPLVPFKSKSGGLHIYMFFKEEILALSAINLLRSFSCFLSIDTLVKNRKNSMVEIFPKQNKLNTGEVGSWINLPYYNAADCKNPALREGKELSLNESITYIKEKQVTLEDAKGFLEGVEYQDAPPCLQLINILDPLEKNSGRNNYLFSFGVYLKKKDENFFEQNLKDINEGLSYPISEKELDVTVINSLRKKDYLYKCKENPCVDFCNKKICRDREFGIGKNEGYFSSVECGQLYQYKIQSPYYEWEVRLQGQEEFKKLRFKTEDEIIKQDAFLRLCMRELYELPSKLKQVEWFTKINQALKEIKKVEIHTEEDTSPIMILKNMFMEFLTSRAMAETREQILVKRVYFDKMTNEYMFRVKDLNEYIFITKQFRYFTPGELHGFLKEFKCYYKQVRMNDKITARVAIVSQNDIDNYTEAELFTPNFEEFKDDGF